MHLWLTHGGRLVYINSVTTALLKPARGKTQHELAALVNELTLAKQRIDRLLRKAEAALPDNAKRSGTGAHASALDQVKAVTAATSKLRAPNGNLSAEPVAKLYGVSLSQLAEWLGRTRQAVTKTPDADSLQEPLSAFERAARLTLVISPEAFRKWLRTPNASLDGKRPLDLLADGQGRMVGELVEDMLTGAPA